ncbi:hypothetical protein PCI56_02465 [Plesiomonas shigelloides subsp. oncorhynchi]|nr:hypothetical protein [Plesiomonas shigelloides]
MRMQHNHPSHTQNVAPFGVYLYVVKWVESVLADAWVKNVKMELQHNHMNKLYFYNLQGH